MKLILGFGCHCRNSAEKGCLLSRFHFTAVATFWVMSLVGIYPGKASLVLVAVGVVGKFGALFVSIPDPIIGDVYMVMFGMIAAVGISNLQFADMNSSRNLFIDGFSIVFGLALPHYMNAHPDATSTDTIGCYIHISLLLYSYF